MGRKKNLRISPQAAPKRAQGNEIARIAVGRFAKNELGVALCGHAQAADVADAKAMIHLEAPAGASDTRAREHAGARGRGRTADVSRSSLKYRGAT
jgi:hypothetical protein